MTGSGKQPKGAGKDGVRKDARKCAERVTSRVMRTLKRESPHDRRMLTKRMVPKEPASIAEWIRQATERRRERWRREDCASLFSMRFSKAYEKAIKDGCAEDFGQVYNLGYSDAETGNPYRLPDNGSGQ